MDFRIFGKAQETNQLAGAVWRHGDVIYIDWKTSKVKDQTGGPDVDWTLLEGILKKNLKIRD
jgi:hypothetical protein